MEIAGKGGVIGTVFTEVDIDETLPSCEQIVKGFRGLMAQLLQCHSSRLVLRNIGQGNAKIQVMRVFIGQAQYILAG